LFDVRTIPKNTNYEIAVKPVGYPDTALICGRDIDDHTESGWVFLRPEEYEEYQGGERVFRLWGPDSSSTASKVRVSDDIVEGLNRWVKQDEDESKSNFQSQASIDEYE
jgi:hypothetical protein